MDETPEEPRKHELLPIVLMGGFFIIINGLALLLTSTFQSAGLKVFQNTNDPWNLVVLFVMILGVTVVILLIARFWKKQLIQVIILFAVGYTAFYLFLPLFSLVLSSDWMIIFLSVLFAVILVAVLVRYPEWYVIDLSGIIIGTGAVALFGISLSILLVIIFLIGLAVYDAISVYKTKHMIDLADTVMDLKLPVLLVIPKIRRYSLIKETKRLKEQIKAGEERDAFFMGLGDVVMPGILVASVYTNIPNGLWVAFSVIVGTLVGFTVLMTFVVKGKPQAGLPLLCSGAILGYVISSYAFFGTLVGLGPLF
ncbi:MAG TPA: presenilin family intramembrane aspartyl protease PSH [Candidatus Thermoplasmatota archaeon]|nr:presenilin family intramembrane aspartyl protease PSH [Candidatus Thermoplasmatota archaeon]